VLVAVKTADYLKLEEESFFYAFKRNLFGVFVEERFSFFSVSASRFLNFFSLKSAKEKLWFFHS
jgi:hypothetical protein